MIIISQLQRVKTGREEYRKNTNRGQIVFLDPPKSQDLGKREFQGKVLLSNYKRGTLGRVTVHSCVAAGIGDLSGISWVFV